MLESLDPSVRDVRGVRAGWYGADIVKACPFGPRLDASARGCVGGLNPKTRCGLPLGTRTNPTGTVLNFSTADLVAHHDARRRTSTASSSSYEVVLLTSNREGRWRRVGAEFGNLIVSTVRFSEGLRPRRGQDRERL
jgi:hypothetical protein